MAHEVAWTKVILEEFIDKAMLTVEEEMIMRTRLAGWSRVKQADVLGMSVANVDKIIARLKHKYDSAQAHSLILPKRARGVRL